MKKSSGRVGYRDPVRPWLGGSSGEQLWMEALTHCQKRRLWPQNGGTRGRGGAEEKRKEGTETFVVKSESIVTFPFSYHNCLWFSFLRSVLDEGSLEPKVLAMSK